MKCKVERIKPAVCKISIELGKEDMEREWERVYKELSSEVTLPGFRPGHIPREILEKRFRDVAEKKFIESVIPKKYEEAIEKESLHPVSMPDVSGVKLQKDSFEFSLTFETKPHFTPVGYRGIPIKIEELEVKEEEVDKIVDNLRASFKEGLNIELPPAEEEKRFLQSMGVSELKELKELLKSELYINKFNLRAENIRIQMMEHLLKENKEVIVPPTMLNETHKRLVEQEIESLRAQGMKDEDLSKYRKDIEEKLKPAVEKNIKFHIILENIAETESIKEDDSRHLIDRVVAFILSQADFRRGRLV